MTDSVSRLSWEKREVQLRWAGDVTRVEDVRMSKAVLAGLARYQISPNYALYSRDMIFGR